MATEQHRRSTTTTASPGPMKRLGDAAPAATIASLSHHAISIQRPISPTQTPVSTSAPSTNGLKWAGPGAPLSSSSQTKAGSGGVGGGGAAPHSMRNVAMLALLGSSWLFATYLLSLQVPTIPKRIPQSLDELRSLQLVVHGLLHTHPLPVILLFVSIYLLLQAFMVPGVVMILNILGGSIFPRPFNYILIHMLSCTGSMIAYKLSQVFLRDLAVSLAPDRIHAFRSELQRHRHHLTHYLVALRFTPIAPHWFINFASPIVKIPLKFYAIGCIVGLLPCNLLTVRAGETLPRLRTMSDMYSTETYVLLTVAIVLALLPIAWKRYQEKSASGVAKE